MHIFQNIFDSDRDSPMSEISEYLMYEDAEQYNPLYQDHIYHIDLLTFLTDFMHKFKTVPSFENYVSLLEAKEREALISINVINI